MVIYLTGNEILEFNRNFVGPDHLRDFGLLDGAVMRPQASAFGEDAFPTIHEKAAALLHGLARNHPFVDGNKRTAWTATAMFYLVNGFNLHLDTIDVVTLTVDAAEGQIGVQDIAATLKNWAQPIPTADDWMETPPDLSAGYGENIEDNARDEEEQNFATEVVEWVQDRYEKDQELVANFREGLASLYDSQAVIAKEMWEFFAARKPIPEDILQQVRQQRQQLLDVGLEIEVPPEEWGELVNSIPVFGLLEVYDEICERGGFPARERHRPSPSRRAKKKRKRPRR